MVFKLFLIISFIFILNCQNSLKDLKKETESECKDPTHKHYPLINLGYITPWTKKGYEMVKKFYNKFDIISPVWFELVTERLNNRFKVNIDGSNDIDKDLLKTIRNNNPKTKILPRFHCQNIYSNDLSEWLSDKGINDFVKILMRRLKYNQFDGMVLDCIGIFYLRNVYQGVKQLFKAIHEEFEKNKMQLIVTIFPYSETATNYVGKEEFKEMSQYVDYFNIMTYDYTSHHRQNENYSPYNAPISWIGKTISYYVDEEKNKNLLKKILIGIPFHGEIIGIENEKGKREILTAQKFNFYLTKGTEKEFRWDEKESEHIMKINLGDKRFQTVYPTKKFIKQRLEYTKEKGIGGCAIWDIGNGYESFLDDF